MAQLTFSDIENLTSTLEAVNCNPSMKIAFEPIPKDGSARPRRNTN